MIKFSSEKVKLLHQLMAQATGGSVGVRDEGLLDSAIEGAFATFDGVELYPLKEEKAAPQKIRGFELDALTTERTIALKKQKRRFGNPKRRFCFLCHTHPIRKSLLHVEAEAHTIVILADFTHGLYRLVTAECSDGLEHGEQFL